MQNLSFVWLAALAGQISAQYVFNNTIASCADVDCPALEDGTTRAQCVVGNRSHLHVGMRTVSSAITDEGADLTWTLGMQSHDLDDRVRVVEKDFYVGTPRGLELKSGELPYAGCAILLHGNEMVKGDGDDGRGCEEVVGAECWDNLRDEARELFRRFSGENASSTPEEVCERTREGLNTTFPRGCDAVSGAEFWHQSEAILLTGPNAPQPLSEAANQSSNCHPTLPKSNDLTHVFAYNETGTMYYNSTSYMINSVNLILTAFWSANGSVEGGLEEPDAQLTCLWPVDINDRMLETAQPGAASVLRSFGWTAGALAFVVGLSLFV